MSQSRRIAPPNSLLFIEDIPGGEVPHPVRGAEILATPSCVSVACLAFMDGETEIMLGLAAEVDPGGPQAFDGDHCDAFAQTCRVDGRNRKDPGDDGPWC